MLCSSTPRKSASSNRAGSSAITNSASATLPPERSGKYEGEASYPISRSSLSNPMFSQLSENSSPNASSTATAHHFAAPGGDILTGSMPASGRRANLVRAASAMVMATGETI